MLDPALLGELTDQERRVIAKALQLSAMLVDDMTKTLELSVLQLKVLGTLRFEETR